MGLYCEWRSGVLKSYAVRYSLTAFVVSTLFAATYAVADLIEASRAITLSDFIVHVGWDDWLVLMLPLVFTPFAYLAGRQRDRVAALAREREALNDILRTLMHVTDPDLELGLPRALRQIAAALRADAAALLTIEREQWLVRATSAQFDWRQLARALPSPPEAAQRIVTCAVVAPQELDKLPAPNRQRRAIGVVVYLEEQPAGWLMLLTTPAQAAQRASDDLLITLADQIGVALARGRQYALMRRRARDLDAITQTNRLLLAGMDLDELLQTIVNSVQVRFGLPYVRVMWLDQAAGELYLRAQAGPLAALARPNFRLKVTEGLVGRVLRTGQPYLARDAQQEPDYIPAVNASIRSLLLTPLKTAGKVIGVMTFESQAVDAFSAEEVSALTALTDQAAIAAENAALLLEAQRERQQVAAILRSARDVVLLIDMEDRVQLLNLAAERLLGVSASAAVGHPIDRLLPFPAVLDAYRQHVAEEQSFEATLDNDLTYLVTITTANDETGARFGRVVIMRDITYLKRLDQFKSQMVQMASHDLRTPLGVAIGYLDVIKEDLKPMTPLQERAMQGMENALSRMQMLVVELLDLERVESGVDALRVQTNVGSLAAEVVAEAEEAAQARHQHLALMSHDHLPPVMGDPARLKQAIGNLVSNALKYTPDGGSIWVRVRPEGQRIVIEVQDTGYGIPGAAQAKLFQRFYRVKLPGREDIEGTGLGLSLVKAVVEQHGGRVAAESEQGKGSTFRIWLPVAMNNEQ
jgi:signal transduction histidine kinase